MYKSLKNGLAALLLALAGPCFADVITFDNLDPSVYGDGESVLVGDGFRVTTLGMGLVGDSASCFVAVCPQGNDSQYWSALNDGGIWFDRVDGQGFQLLGFDAAFLAPMPVNAVGDVIARIILDVFHGENYARYQFDLPAQAENGSFYFGHIDLYGIDAVFADISALRFFACTFDSAGECSNPNENLGQFALDDIRIPTGQTVTLFGLGLLALALLRRRA